MPDASRRSVGLEGLQLVGRPDDVLVGSVRVASQVKRHVWRAAGADTDGADGESRQSDTAGLRDRPRRLGRAKQDLEAALDGLPREIECMHVRTVGFACHVDGKTAIVPMCPPPTIRRGKLQCAQQTIFAGRSGREPWHLGAMRTGVRSAHGRGRYTLWTGDLGTALYLRGCIEATLAREAAT